MNRLAVENHRQMAIDQSDVEGLPFAGWLFSSKLVEGWTSTVVILAFLGGVNLMMFGIVGLYVGRIYEQVKNRPLYIVDGPPQWTPGRHSAA